MQSPPRQGNSSQAVSPGTGPKSTGVSALKARFEASSATTSAATPPSPSSRKKTSVSIGESGSSAGEDQTPGIEAVADTESSLVPSEDDTTLSQPAVDESRRDESLVDHESESLSETVQAEIPPSVGAVSLIDPEATIENPFNEDGTSAQDERRKSRRRTIQATNDRDGEEEAAMAGSSVWSDDPTPVIGQPARQAEAAETRDDEPQLPSTPSGTSSAHFSAISLSDTPAREDTRAWASTDAYETSSRRTTMTGISQNGTKPAVLPAGEPVTASVAARASRMSVQFQERLRSRLSGGGGDDQRASHEGAEKLKEEFERLHHQHERSLSSSSNPRFSTVASGVVASTSSGTEVIAEPPRAIAGSSQSDESQDGIDWDFWGRIMSNYQQVAQENPQELSQAIQAGIPAQLRGLCWQLLSASKDEEMEIIYAYYLRQTSSHEKQIRKDLSRTFPEQDYFKDGKGVGQENLFNVVKAYSLYDEECGYCQGMQFIVGPLLLNMPDEEAFSTLVRLMKSYGLRGHFEPNMPALQLRLFQFERLLEDMLPLLHRHLVRQGIKTSMYASQWFMTLFSYRFPLEFVYRILDSVFAEGIEAIFRFAVALMRRSEDDLLERPFEQILEYLKGAQLFEHYRIESSTAVETAAAAAAATNDGVRVPSRGSRGGGAAVGNTASGQPASSSESDCFDVNAFAREAYVVEISPFTLDNYAAEFDERTRAANAHRREVEALRLVNRNLAAKVSSLEEQLQQINAEHVDLVKQVVMSKIAKEEMEEELIQYKMHASQATSS
ncbi:unnamed protein product [Parajaminaea phylloscopi]